MLEIICPPDFTSFFRTGADLDPAALHEWEGLAERHGLEFDFAWVDDLSARYGVTIDMAG